MCHSWRSSSTVARERRKAVVANPSRTAGNVSLGRAASWVVVDFDAHALKCERCGALHKLKGVVSLADLLSDKGEAFQRLHADCEAPDA